MVISGPSRLTRTVVVAPLNSCGRHAAGMLFEDRRLSSTANTRPHLACTSRPLRQQQVLPTLRTSSQGGGSLPGWLGRVDLPRPLQGAKAGTILPESGRLTGHVFAREDATEDLGHNPAHTRRNPDTSGVRASSEPGHESNGLRRASERAHLEVVGHVGLPDMRGCKAR